MDKNIVLIGMPSSGKSTIGVVLAKALGKKFIDTDLVIQEQENQLLQEIINKKGLSYFKLAEEKAILSLSEISDTVISTGGSAIYSRKAMQGLKANSYVFYLNLPYNQILSRLHNLSTRGIAMNNGQSLKQLYNERTPLYKKYADYIIDCDDKKIHSIVNEIVDKINM
ncbi:MAG: shikimate kinase [Clostridiales bacterium]|nr:shikimate kinase [Clostridiales bacterium]